MRQNIYMFSTKANMCTDDDNLRPMSCVKDTGHLKEEIPTLLNETAYGIDFVYFREHL